MKRNKLTYITTLLMLAAAILLSACSKKEEAKPVYESVRELNELQLASATVTKMYTVRDPYYDDQEKSASFDLIDRVERSLHILEHAVKVGDRIGIYGIKREYVAVMDLSQLTEANVKIEKAGGVKKIAINLPPIEIRTVGNDFTTDVYHERSSGLRSGITESERVAMRQKASARLTKDMKNSSSQELASLKAQGEVKAIEFFNTMLVNMGYAPTVTIKK